MDSAFRASWIGWRNRVLASARFQRWAARFPLTRPVARRRARTLFDLVAGFVYAQILAAVVDLRLLELLAKEPLDTVTIATRIDCPEGSARVLLRGAAALRLVQPVGDRWALGADGAAMLGNRGIAEMVAHHRLLYADLADPVALLRRGGGGGALAGLWSYAEHPGAGDAEAVRAYSALMAASQPLVSGHILDAYDFSRHRRVLDVGGGEGKFLSELGARHTDIRLGLFDLPPVCARARVRLADAGLLGRAEFFPGNFRCDSLPRGFDAITLVRVLHDHDDAPAESLLRAAFAALPIGGTLLIAEPMAATPGAEPAGDAYFGFYLLAMGSGRPRRPDEVFAMLRRAGFARMRLVFTAVPLSVRIIVAERGPNTPSLDSISVQLS